MRSRDARGILSRHTPCVPSVNTLKSLSAIPESPVMASRRLSSVPFLVSMLVWFVFACLAGVSGRVASLTPPQPQLMIAALSVLLLVSGWVLPGLRAWLGQVNLRGFVAFHVTRFVGIV